MNVQAVCGARRWADMGLHRRLAAVAGALVQVGLVGASLLSPEAVVAAPLGPPELFESETVTVRQVVTAREVLVERADRARIRVRFPGVTVPEGLIDGRPVCGAESARRALEALLPVGAKADLSILPRDRWTSWVPVASGAQADVAQFAADGALYGEVRNWSLKDPDLEGSVLEPLAARGWLKSGVLYPTALADPTEINLSTIEALMNVEGLEIDARRRQRGAYRECGGNFRAASPAPVVPTNWVVSRSGKVTSIGGVAIRQNLRIADLAAVLGPVQLSVGDNFCTASWPERDLEVMTSGMLKADGDTILPPPTTEAACLERPVYDVVGMGPRTHLGTLPPGPSLARAQRRVPTLAVMKDNPRYVVSGPGASRGRDRATYLWGELDRKRRVAGLSVTLPKPTGGW